MKKIRINKNKKIIIENDIVYFLNPDAVFLPTNAINKNNVCKNDIINNVICPISGNVNKVININNKDYLRIDNDFRELSKNNSNKYKDLTIDLIKKVLKDNNKDDLLNKFKNNINYIVINVINDNPYIYNKIYLLKEKIKDILEIINKISLLYKVDNSYLVMKSNESFIINETLDLIGTYPNIKITLVDDYYLIEQKDYILDTLELDGNVLYLDINELIELDSLLNGNDNTTKLITISGDAIEKSLVLRIKKYTLLKEIIKKYIKINTNDFKIIVNGLMNGYEIDKNNNLIIDDDINYINIMKNKDNKEYKCINCGKCIEICPKRVNPLTLRNKKKCIDCGLCTYICPCNINLRKIIKGDKHE